jgi:hypothetical protein
MQSQQDRVLCEKKGDLLRSRASIADIERRSTSLEQLDPSRAEREHLGVALVRNRSRPAPRCARE